MFCQKAHGIRDFLALLVGWMGQDPEFYRWKMSVFCINTQRIISFYDMTRNQAKSTSTLDQAELCES